MQSISTNYLLTFRPMALDDVPLLKLDEEWMYERFHNYIECDNGPALVIEEQGQALCAFGIIFEWGLAGACEVWFNLIENKRTFNIARILKRTIEKMVVQHKITRMQAIVRCDSAVNLRFMRFMGFVNETPHGMKNKLPDGHSAFLYSRCF